MVPLENRADFLIADHARRDAPPGSYSWRLIDDAVKNGGMGNKEDYLIHRAVAASRPPGSSQPGKGTRTPFTAADDELLWRWTLLNERQGNSLKGNMIWPTLANMVMRLRLPLFYFPADIDQVSAPYLAILERPMDEEAVPDGTPPTLAICR